MWREYSQNRIKTSTKHAHWSLFVLFSHSRVFLVDVLSCSLCNCDTLLLSLDVKMDHIADCLYCCRDDLPGNLSKHHYPRKKFFTYKSPPKENKTSPVFILSRSPLEAVHKYYITLISNLFGLNTVTSGTFPNPDKCPK